ncbi:MAG: NAD-dependent deacylase [Spirochaetales bacterium]|nr:NAD-dependent deacylase [Leptospiraceae bacterium]MCP5481884.1 NAD-dependent deacylase [Spirochaetales bacterium]MCP5486309.1 NAD-dependent deacylase [Spirochaetales bacterium]
MKTRLKEAANLLRRARHAIALTGAGISVPSGIPDFRSPGSGLWEQYDPFEVASIEAFRAHPERFYDWIRPLLAGFATARPNPAHLALSRLQQLGFLREVITQNIDGLHEKAGTREVLAVHGQADTVSCIVCGHRVSGADTRHAIESGAVPACALCHGVYKPDVVLFGEPLPPETTERAWRAAEMADVIVVAGSSLEVFPVNELPALVLQNQGSLVLINQGPTPFDRLASVRISGDVVEVLPAIADLLGTVPEGLSD